MVLALSRIKVALIGVGNCASALVQGVHYYKDAESEEDTIGLKHTSLGGYHPRDIEFVSAFDIDDRKVGKDLSRAIFSPPNNTSKFTRVPKLDVSVSKGPILDGVGRYLKDVVQISQTKEEDLVQVLQGKDAEIVINLLPSGAMKASEWYAEQALKAGCAFVNLAPVFIASDASWSRRFENAGLPVVGDDLRDQVGATVLHKILLKTLADQGVRVLETYQLDVGGGTESLDTLERARERKRFVKTKSVRSALPYSASVVAGSTDYVDFLGNRRDSYFWIKGAYFAGAPMQLDIRLNTIDAPNAGSLLLDVIRSVKIALDRKASGALPSICAYAFKHPPETLPLEASKQSFIQFVEGEKER
jgi:myo-inositol-1-phosphate synthase